MIEMHEIIPRLWLSGQPHEEDIPQMKEKKIELVVTMHIQRLNRAIRDEFVHLKLPWVDFVLLPQPLSLLHGGVVKVAEYLDENKSVLVHCREGVHRSVALVGCVLVAEGCSSEDAMKLIKKERLVADPGAWHVKRQIKRYEDYRRKQLS